MADINKFKAKIKTNESAKKITKAMKMISTSKLRNLQREKMNLDLFFPRFFSVFKSFYSLEKSFLNLTPLNYNIVLITTDRGLCGSINNLNMKKYGFMIHRLITFANYNNNKHSVSTTCFGNKGLLFISKYKYFTKMDDTFVFSELNKKNTFFNWMNNVIKQIFDCLPKENLLESQKYGCDLTIFFFHRFYSTMVNKLRIQFFFSKPLFKTSNVAKKNDKNVTTNPNVWEYFYITHLFYSIINNSKSELASRINVMQNSINSAEKLISKLVIQENKTRQSLITRELSELVAGLNATFIE